MAARTLHTYNDSSRTITTQNDLNSLGDGALRSELAYDGLGRTTETRQYESSGFIAVCQSYDGMGRVAQRSNPDRAAATASGCSLTSPQWTTMQYDSLSRVTSVGMTQAGQDGAVTTTIYQGNQTTVTEPGAISRRRLSDALGRLTQVIEDPSGTPKQTDYTYDALDNLTQVNQGGQMRSFTYDSLRRLRSATNPESGTVSYPAYDDNGNLVRRTDARGVTTTYAYDPLNRLVSRSYSDSTPAVSYVYDTVWKGRLSAVSNAVSSTAFTQYDALGRATASTQTTAGVSFPFSYSFNRAGALKTLGYPSGRVVSYSFDAAGRVGGVTGQKGATSTTYASLVNYAPQGALSGLTLGNGLVEGRQYSLQRQQPTSISLGSVFGVNLYYCPFQGSSCSTNNGNIRTQTIDPLGARQDYTQDYT